MNDPNYQPRQRPAETVLASKTFAAERKSLTVSYCENPRGKFLRILEEFSGKRSQIIVPESAIDEFVDTISEVAPAQN